MTKLEEFIRRELWEHEDDIAYDEGYTDALNAVLAFIEEEQNDEG